MWQEKDDVVVDDNAEKSVEEERRTLKAPRIAMELLLSLEQEIVDKHKKELADRWEELPKCPICGKEQLPKDGDDPAMEEDMPETQYEQVALDDGGGAGGGG